MTEPTASLATGPRKGRVIVGVDGSDPSLRAARWAAEYAGLTGSELRLVTAWHWPAMYGTVPAPGLDFEGDARAVVVKATDELRRESPELPIEFDVASGHGGPSPPRRLAGS
ncbi:MAG TPA: universal stress protein [Acidimicrobiales bacterium]|nr:universal stress protein [Acidimicrobiales bacterium]